MESPPRPFARVAPALLRVSCPCQDQEDRIVVGFIIVALFLLALIIFVAYTYWKPGPAHDQLRNSPESLEGEQW
jgi:hypothetical protein